MLHFYHTLKIFFLKGIFKDLKKKIIILLFTSIFIKFFIYPTSNNRITKGFSLLINLFYAYFEDFCILFSGHLFFFNSQLKW